jgi:type I restriction enzyme S subunit
MTWPQKRIGDYLIESSIGTSAPSAERRIRVRLNAEGIEKRPLIAETEGATRYFQRKVGQFIYGKQNLHKGAFGVVPPELDGFESSSDLPAFDVADGLRPEWLEYFLKQGNFYKSLVAIAKGAATKRIQPEALFAVELPVPATKIQDEIIKRMDLCALEHTRLEHEITHQQSLLAKLKQAILQEAIQGKLTADWRAAHPDVEPASHLLHRIQAEKARLIAAKKLRPEKPLPKITPAEIPFEIPKGWEWCRMGDINMKFLGGEAYQSTSILPSGTNQVVRIGNIKPDTLELSKRPAFISDSLAEETSGSRLHPGDILVTMTGTYQKKDYCYSVLLTEEHFVDRQLYQNQRVGCFRLHPEVHNPFLIRALKLAPLLDPVFESSTGAANQANISKGALLNILIPLPPLAEQAAIVERVEALMTTCRALEAEIEHARTHAAHLLQAVLKEAFAPASGAA